VRLAALIVSGDRTDLFESRRAEIAHLARLDRDRLHIAPSLKAIPQKALSLVQASATIYLPFAQMVDLDAERARLKKELAEADALIKRSEGMLKSDFARKAPDAVVQKERDKLTALKEKQVKLGEQIKALM